MKRFFCFKDTGRAKSAPELNAKKNSGSSSNSGPKRGSSVRSERTLPELYEENAHKLRVFSFSQLRRATSDFSKLCKVGEGGFGSVYKGVINPPDGEGDGIVVAVKKLKRDGLQGHKEWVAEVRCLGVVDHPNLVKLIGYCALDGERGIQRLLVYEYITNRTLDDHLFSRALRVLPWLTRLHIVLGAAQGLAYLHGEFEVQVIYRDFKSSNVLLDHDFKPKLSDFGLAREGPKGANTHVSTAVVGTHGYAAPEYVETGHLSTKSDVWSFGVVLYEILTGRRTLESNRPKEEQKLLEWVKEFPASSKKFSRIIDQRLGIRYSLGAAINIAKLADKCILKDKNDRPEMSEVVESLKKAIKQSQMEEDDLKQSQNTAKSPLHYIARSPKPANKR